LTDAVRPEGFSDQGYRQAKDRYDRAVGALREAELAVVEARGALTRAEDDIREAKRRESERAERERHIAELKARQRLHNELDRAFSDLRAELNAQMRPEIAELASGFLADLTDGRYDELELTEDYTVTILEAGVPKPVISGGEEDVANLVLRLAISQMIAERAGQPLSLLVLDEIFGSLDEARRLHVVGLLRRLADRFPQVILITHIEQGRDGLVGVRVPHLNPQVWRYALLDAGAGAMLWRDEAGHVVAFNVAHRSGTEGWMGPLAVRPDRQGAGVGKAIVRAAVDWLIEQGVATLGLETMPRTVENIGFY